jgi:Concanavalin A-like lectin/glucanases superfamily
MIVRRQRYLEIVLLLCAIGIVTFSARSGDADTRRAAGLLAWYSFRENKGRDIHDRSNNRNDGLVIGDYSWNMPPDHGLSLSGTSYVRVPSSLGLQLFRQFSIVTWIQGKGAGPRFVEQPNDDTQIRRSPYFQVCGDRLVFTYNTDITDDDGHQDFEGLWFGDAAVNLSSWRDHYAATEGAEPKLQALSEGIEYEYWGRDGLGEWQIWTGTSARNFAEFRPVQQTFHFLKTGSPKDEVEQSGNLQVVGDRVFYAFPQRDGNGPWQLWTASSNRDGSDFVVQQRTTEGGWIPIFQVVRGSIYYMFKQAGYWNSILYVAKSDIDGGHWRILARFEDDPEDLYGGGMKVDKNRLFFAYPRIRSDGAEELLTGSMNLEGEDLAVVHQNVPATSVYQLQIVGNRVVYALGEGKLARSGVVLGSARRDGSQWQSTTLMNYPPSSTLGYKPFVIVGGKTYYSANRQYPPRGFLRTLLGTSGSNIVSKGDSYGLGLSESSQVSAFLNVGEDYLYRGEAPMDTGGATALGSVDEKRSHQLAEVYDGRLLKLYIDGKEVSRTEYTAAAGQNEFPLLLGDGLIGALKDVRIFDRALASDAIGRLYDSGLKEN